MKRRHKLRSNTLISAINISDGPFAVIALVFICLVLILSSASQAPFISKMRVSAQDALTPSLSFISQPIQNAALFVRDVSGLAALQADNLALRAENEKLRTWYHKAMALNHENESLRHLLNMPLESMTQFVSARIVMDTQSAYVKSFLVDSGADQGVSKGDSVLSGDGLVGRIIETGDQSSRVLLLNDISSRVPVVLQGSARQAIMAGQNTGLPALVHMGDRLNVHNGTQVLTSGVGGVFPAGVPVGLVKNDQYGDPHVALYADIDNLLFVRIVEKPSVTGFTKLRN